jgi:phospholipase D1/2
VRPASSKERIDGGAHVEWCERTQRFAPLVNGVEYFRAVRSSLIEARRRVFILGWEIHSEIDLLRGEEADRAVEEDGWPVRLADLLLKLVDVRPDLEVRMLIWEGASLFALERQHVPRMKQPWNKHARITLHWDRDTPQLGSQHQKVVVIDDAVAFAGGMDLTKARWDSHDHKLEDRRRRKPGLLPSYSDPYHDAMVALDGPAARRLGEWCRERWARSTNERVNNEEPEPDGHEEVDAWPSGVAPLLRDIEVGIALTQPDYAEREEKRQVEQSLLDQIAAARNLIFIETQYFTSETLGEALCERLREEDGPEVVLILPYGCPGRLQAMAMDTRRDALLDTLRDADRGDRLGVYWATLAGDDDHDDVHARAVYIHAKTMVVDDRLLRIGSANFNNRSMGLDTELDIFTKVDEDAQDAIAAYRRGLLSNLLHVDVQQISDEEDSKGSVLRAIEALRGGERTLHPFDHRASELAQAAPFDLELADPNRPIDMGADAVLRAIARETKFRDRLGKVASIVIGAMRRHKGVLILVGVVIAVSLLIVLTPVDQAFNREWVGGVIESVRSSPLGLAGVTGLFIVLASIGFPITVLIAVLGATLPAAWAIPLCIVGVIGASLPGYVLARAARDRIDAHLSSAVLRRLESRLRDHGVLAVAIVRNVPVAPFAVMNIALATLGCSAMSYLLGTVLGMLPGMVVIILFGSEIRNVITDPTPLAVARLIGVGVLLVGAAVASDALLKRLRQTDDEATDGGT